MAGHCRGTEVLEQEAKVRSPSIVVGQRRADVGLENKVIKKKGKDGLLMVNNGTLWPETDRDVSVADNDVLKGSCSR